MTINNNNLNIQNKIIININNFTHNSKKKFKKQKTLQLLNTNSKTNSRNHIYSISKLENSNNLNNTKKSIDSIIHLNSLLLKQSNEKSIKKIGNKSRKLSINKSNDKKRLKMGSDNINKEDIISEKPQNKEKDNNNKKNNDKYLYFQNCINNLPKNERAKYFYEVELNKFGI